jgi:uncharacterized protein (TIGR01777 family)
MTCVGSNFPYAFTTLTQRFAHVFVCTGSEEKQHMKAIITGGTGLIGRALSAKLLAKHYEVHVLSRNPDKYRRNALNGVQLHQWDAKTGDGWSHLIDSKTAIINLAGASIAGERLFPPQKWTESRKNLIRDSRIDAGAAVVDAIEKAEEKPSVVIQPSAIGRYGTDNGDTELTEEHPPAEDFLGSVTVVWEKSTEPVEDMGIRRCIVRNGIVLSKRGGALPPMLLQFRLFAGGPTGDGNQWMSWVHIEDTVGAIVHLIENEELSGAFNLTAPNPVRNYQFAKALGKALGRPSFMPVPAFAMKLAFGELSTVLLDGQRVVPSALEESGYDFKFAEVEPALKDVVASDLY